MVRIFMHKTVIILLYLMIYPSLCVAKVDLLSAVSNGKLDQVKTYIESGKDVDTPRDLFNHTALMIAAAEGHLNVVKLLLKAKANVNLEGGKEYHPRTALMAAVSVGHIKVTKHLINAKADVNQKVKDNTALQWMMERKNKNKADILKELIRGGANINLPFEHGSTILIQLIKAGEVEALRVLLKHKPDFTIKNKHGQTAISSAMFQAQSQGQKNSFRILKLLLRSNANFSQTGNYDQTPLMSLVVTPDNERCVKAVQILIDHKVDLRVQNKKGDTALMIAIRSSYSAKKEALKILKILMKDKKTLNMVNKAGESPLYTAVRNDYVEIAKALLKAGANPNILDRSKKTVLFVTEKNLKMLKALLDHGVDPNLQNKEGRTFLMSRIFIKYNEVVKLLIKHGAKINVVSKVDKKTALMIAAGQNNWEIVSLLLKKRAKVNAQDEKGNTALIEGASSKNIEIIKALLKRGAKINHKNSYGKSALLYAARRKHLDHIKLLVNKGADVNIQTSSGLNTLFYMTRANQEELVRLLFKKGAKANLQNNEGNTALFYVSSPAIAKLFLENKADLNIKNKKGKTAIDFIKSEEVKKILRAHQSSK